MMSILLIVATTFFVGLAVYPVKTRGVRRGRFLVGLLAQRAAHHVVCALTAAISPMIYPVA